MTVYEPGTVAVATVRGVPNVRVMYVEHDSFPWFSVDGHRQRDDEVTDVRPLVVLDLDPTETVGELGDRANESQRLVEMLRETADEFFVPDAAALARKVADQIEAQTKPPFVPRFRLGGLVRFIGSPTESEPWTKRRTEKHLGIVVENYRDGEVRVYDTVEHDWWQCDETRLTAHEDGAK